MIINQLQEKIKESLKAGEAEKTSAYRLLLSALKNEQIAKQHELSEDEELAVIKRLLKQREEAAEVYEKAGRPESAQKEKSEADLLKEFLPEQMSQEEIERIVDKVIEEIGEVRDFGVIMKHTMANLGGKADGKLVSDIVRKKL